MEADYEKLGLFYLGRPLDPAAGEEGQGWLLYDSRRLTTHAMIVGMTGSGKTGLGIGLLEEAAIDGVPALVIDPKGDLANLALVFPELDGASFAPWVDEEEARRRGIGRDELGAAEAARWREGLAKWGQGPERLRRLRAAAEVTVYTPGSTAGRPLAVLATLAAPRGAARDDVEARTERAALTASSLLGLLGVDAGSLQSREHILLTSILDHHWQQGQDLDLGLLIRAVQEPPMRRLGALDLENVFPQRDRFALALQLNNLLAAPGFAVWREGEPLDVERLLWTAEGRPRLAVLSLAHLAERERMFFVSLLLAEVTSWMRGRPGTGSLRALLYMDEVFGYLPPVAEPPSKRAFLGLLKQARAYGLGLVLATQNPADLDYKALTNIGTWFLGRLQAARDKERVLAGLEGAAGGADRATLDRLLSDLPPRAFLLHDVREDTPIVFRTRWAMSYLRGPLTRDEIRRLEPARPPDENVPAAPARRDPDTVAMPAPAGTPEMGHPPVLPPGIVQRWEPGLVAREGPLLLAARVVGWGRVAFHDPRRGIDQDEEVCLLVEPGDDAHSVDWSQAAPAPWGFADLEAAPPGPAVYDDPPSSVADEDSYRPWQKALAEWLYRGHRLRLLRSPSLGVESQPGEEEGAFRRRLADLAREERDRRVATVEQRFAPRLARLDERERRELERHEVQKDQLSGQKLRTAISIGAAVAGALFGRRRLGVGTVGRASTAARSYGRIGKEAGDVQRAEARLGELRRQREELEDALAAELAALETALAPPGEALETVELKPRRTDVRVAGVGLLWQRRAG